MRRCRRASSASEASHREHERARGEPPRRAQPSSSAAALLAALRDLYARVDGALEGWTCDASTDCCRFGITGREPYPTAVELAELERAVRARGGLPKRRTLALAGERRCTLLGDDGRCLVYASRPLGCRTFFCERGRDAAFQRPDAGLPREVIAEIAGEIPALSARFAPSDPGPRPLSRATRRWEGRRGR